MNWDEKSNNQIKTELLSIKQEHESLKHDISLMVFALEKLEEKFNKGNEVLNKRINGISNE